MDLSQFRHQSDSRYCFSIGPHTVLVRLAVAKTLHLDRVDLLYGDTSSFVKKQMRAPMHVLHEDEAFFYYETKMEANPARFLYVFHLSENNHDVFLSESGLTEGYIFNLSFLSAFQFIGENRNDYVLVPPSWQGRLVYQIFPERFASRGDTGKKPYVNKPWGAKGSALGHNAFLGGDLWGLVDKLDYLASLGVGAIYLTPIHPSPSNHKYDVLDYFDVDAAFGGKEAFRHVIEKSHQLGMKVIMDLVFNHVAYDHPFFRDVREKGCESPYHNWFFIDGNKPTKSPLNYTCFQYVTWMPKLDTNNPEVRDYLISVGRFWLDEFGVDGFRLDVSEGVSHDFWIRFKCALKETHPELILFGENWLNSESYLGPDQLDGVMNYPFLGVVSGYLLRQIDAGKTKLRLDGLLMRYKEGHNQMMLNVLSSHDIQRLMNLVQKDRDLVLLGYALSMFYPGMPMVYYGEEVFMEGGADPDNRRGMMWERTDNPDYYVRLFADLMRLRLTGALKTGEAHIENVDGMLRIRRELPQEAITLYLNRTDGPIAVKEVGEALLSNRAAGGFVYPKGFVVLRRF